MVVYMYNDLLEMIKSILRRILKKEVMDKVRTASDVLSLDLTKDSIFKHPHDMDLYCSAKQGLKDAVYVVSTTDRRNSGQSTSSSCGQPCPKFWRDRLCGFQF